jgi:MFS family permease
MNARPEGSLAQIGGSPEDDGPVGRFLVRHRAALFLGVALMHTLAFNGEWRVGRDSALYRHMALGLVDDRCVRATPDVLVMPGYPLLLAGMHKLFGDDVWHPVPQILVMVAMAAATLLVVYRLIALRFARWIAVATTAALGINWKFLQHANELMTDMPFLLGVCGALLGYENLRRASTRGQRAGAFAMTTLALGLAAAMRPTFVALALAWGAGCLWNLVRGRQRLANGLALGSLGLLGAAFLAIVLFWPHDDAHQHYERSLGARLHNLKAILLDHRDPDEPKRSARDEVRPWEKMLAYHFPEAMFGIELWWFSVPMALAAIIYGARLARFDPVWGLFVAVSAVLFALTGSAPRYFLQIMPLLLAAWMWHAGLFARFLPRAYAARSLFVLGALGLLVVPNFGKSVWLIMEQHGVVVDLEGAAPRSSRIVDFLPVVKVDFLRAYRYGAFARIEQIAQTIQGQRVPPNEAILGPEPRILSYLTGRRVLLLGLAMRGRDGTAADYVRKHNVRWAVLPPSIYENTKRALHPDAATHRFLTTDKSLARLAPPATASWWVGPLVLDPPASTKHATKPTTKATRPATKATSPTSKTVKTTKPTTAKTSSTTRKVTPTTRKATPTTRAGEPATRRSRPRTRPVPATQALAPGPAAWSLTTEGACFIILDRMTSPAATSRTSTSVCTKRIDIATSAAGPRPITSLRTSSCIPSRTPSPAGAKNAINPTVAASAAVEMKIGSCASDTLAIESVTNQSAVPVSTQLHSINSRGST